MSRNRIAVAIGVLAVFIVAGGILIYAGRSHGGHNVTFNVTVTGAKTMSPSNLSAHQNDTVTINVTSDTDGEVHLHLYDIIFNEGRSDGQPHLQSRQDGNLRYRVGEHGHWAGPAGGQPVIAETGIFLHGFGQRYDLPISLALYLYAAAGVVVISFVLVVLFAGDQVGAKALQYPAPAGSMAGGGGTFGMAAAHRRRDRDRGPAGRRDHRPLSARPTL